MAPPSKRGEHGEGKDMEETFTSEVEIYQDALDEWYGNEEEPAEEVDKTRGKIDILLNDIDNLLEKETLALLSSEEDQDLCANEVKSLGTLIHALRKGTRKASTSPRASFHTVFDL